MKILIENCVPLNNGDAALIFSIGDRLESMGHEIVYSTSNIKTVEKKYPKKNWKKSLLDYRINRAPIIGYYTLFLSFIYRISFYSKFDIIISAPGGYINSYYGIKRRLQLLILYKKIINKKIYMYSQSIGPLNERDENYLKKSLKFFDLMYVRDDISKRRIDNIGNYSNVVQTKDAAFLLEPFIAERAPQKKIAISVREWNFDSRNKEVYIKLIINIIEYFTKRDYEITFISTCQGHSSYKDDSKIAAEIYSRLNINLKKTVSIDKNVYTLYELRQRLKQFDYTIGTRLHMCILSWLSGTPAFNISYEEKGKECYSYLNLKEYSVDYNFSGNIEPLLEAFTKKLNIEDVFETIEMIHEESEFFLTKLISNSIE